MLIDMTPKALRGCLYIQLWWCMLATTGAISVPAVRYHHRAPGNQIAAQLFPHAVNEHANHSLASRNVSSFARTAKNCPMCTTLTTVGMIPPGIEEPSGLSPSHKHANVYYITSDSPEFLQLFAIKETGEVVGTFNVAGIEYPAGMEFGREDTGDLEALVVGPCLPNSDNTNTCIFLGDIGHNCVRRPVDDRGVTCIWFRPQNLYSIMRFPEPTTLNDGVAELHGERFWFQFPEGDGPYDVETLLAASNGELFIVTKEESGHSGIYRVPPLTLNKTVTVELVSKVYFPHGRSHVPQYVDEVEPSRLVTGGDIRYVHGKSGEDYLLEITLLTYGKILHYNVAGNPSNAPDFTQAFLEETCVEDVDFHYLAEAFTWSYPSAMSYLVVGEGTRQILKAQCTMRSGNSA